MSEPATETAMLGSAVLRRICRTKKLPVLRLVRLHALIRTAEPSSGKTSLVASSMSPKTLPQTSTRSVCRLADEHAGVLIEPWTRLLSSTLCARAALNKTRSSSVRLGTFGITATALERLEVVTAPGTGKWTSPEVFVSFGDEQAPGRLAFQKRCFPCARLSAHPTDLDPQSLCSPVRHTTQRFLPFFSAVG